MTITSKVKKKPKPLCVGDIVPSHYRATTTTSFGIEVELENWAGMADLPDGSVWRTVTDGSLRNGIEFITRGPVPLKEVKAAVVELWGVIKRQRLVPSVRTGIHLHVNCLGFTKEQLGAICTAYTLVEPLLFQFCGEDREEGIYCIPWYRARDQIDIAHDAFMGPDTGIRNFLYRTPRSCKYSALFLQPLNRYGTIEFRHAPTFASADKMLEWVNIVDRLIVYGKSRTAEQVLDQFTSTTPAEFYRLVFGNYVRCFNLRNIDELLDSTDSPWVAYTLVHGNPEPEIAVEGWPRAAEEPQPRRRHRFIEPMIFDEDHPQFHDL